ncbi:MAG: multiheme c-type cytochrome [Planctomycetia bacterium]
MKWLILTFISMAILVAGLCFWYFGDRSSEYARKAPLSSSPLVNRVRPEEWAELVTSGTLRGESWVLLPAEQPDTDFQSTVRAENRGFLTAETCGECHQQNHQTFVHTAHARTSMLPDRESILGSFQEGHNTLVTGNPNLTFRMTARDDGFYQSVRLRDPGLPTEFTQDFRFDLVLGSGNHGQSYLWWKKDRLYQMHISYLTESNSWVNSPGPYTDGTVDYSRPVPSRCLDCHATWIGFDSKEVNRFDRSTLIPGVTCVRCHGSGHEHVAWHRKFPAATEAHRIVNPKTLSIERQNEICAQCHSSGEAIGNAFTYRPGEPLRSWLELDLKTNSESNADPHSANQLARLMQSRCYTAGPGLSCIACHDPHQDQRGQIAEFSQRCQDCHKSDVCPDSRKYGELAKERCVDCHMPTRRDQQVSIDTDKGSVQALLRDHQIGIWPDSAEQVRKELLKTNSPSDPAANPAKGEVP